VDVGRSVRLDAHLLLLGRLVLVVLRMRRMRPALRIGQVAALLLRIDGVTSDARPS
jgi:hypothetical protein